MKRKPEIWAALVEELLSSEPRLAVIKARMRDAGLEPCNDLVDCMERAWKALEPRVKKKEVPNEL
jgi:hypothetical protein